MFKAWAMVVVACGCGLATAAAAEEQNHGLAFEDWVRTTFFEPFERGGYTRKWDIPAKANKRHGGIPANPKATRYRGSIGLGDALRQFDINEPFLLIVGFWEQSDPAVKTMVNTQAVRVEPKVWRELWGNITRADLERLEAVVKDPSLTLEQARAKAKAIKAAPPFPTAAISINPKIDHSQRRLQCSLSFSRFFERLAPGADRSRQDEPILLGTKARKHYPSPPRGGGQG